MIRPYRAEAGELRQVDPSKLTDAVWIDAVAPNPQEVEVLHKEFALDLQDVADCLDPNESSRVEAEEAYDLLVLRAVLKDEHDPNRVQTIPVGMFVTRDRVITVRLGATFGVDDLCADLRRKLRLETKEDLFLALVRRVVRDIDRMVRPLERRVGAIQEEILSTSRKDVSKVAFGLSNSLVLMNTALLSNLNAVSMLSKMRQLKMKKAQMDLLEDIENDISQQYEMTTIYREIMSNVLTAYESAIANRLGAVMKTLTTISLILILPTLIASLYGMNLELPLQDSPLAFWFIIGVSAAAVVVLWVLFRLKQIL